MKRETRNETIHELKRQGFRLVKEYKYLYINELGKIYSLRQGKYLKPTAQNYIPLEKGYLSVPKLVLLVFKEQTYRTGQIHYIDGNKRNLSGENLKYSCLFSTDINVTVNKTDLMSAIRCYFEVDKHYSISDALKTRMYLSTINEISGFVILNKNKPYIEVYKSYINVELFGLKSIEQTAKNHSLSVRDCTIIVNSFTNELINKILQKKESGQLNELPYKAKQPTKTEQTRHINEYLTTHGHTALPLRKKGAKSK